MHKKEHAEDFVVLYERVFMYVYVRVFVINCTITSA